MSKVFAAEKTVEKRVDFTLLSTLILLIGIGTTTLYSASAYLGENLFNDSAYFLKNHLLRLVVGGFLAWIISYVPLGLFKRFLSWILLGTLILLLMTYLPFFSREIMGARRWIYLGPLSFQPSELVKLTIIIYLAYNFSKNEHRKGELHNTLLPPLIVIILFLLLVLLQNDFSSSFLILALCFFMFIVSGLSFRVIIPGVMFLTPMVLVFMFTKPYRVQRIISFLFPQSDPSGAGYQILASRKAIALGGVWGSGPGGGVRKLGKLPEVYADFIFAALGEEMGFIGISFVLMLFVLLAYRGFIIARKVDDRFQFYMAVGITLSIILQAFTNVAVVSGLVPATGIPLPFFSYGGSNILVSLVMMGILLNISRGQSPQGERTLFREVSHG